MDHSNIMDHLNFTDHSKFMDYSNLGSFKLFMRLYESFILCTLESRSDGFQESRDPIAISIGVKCCHAFDLSKSQFALNPFGITLE